MIEDIAAEAKDKMEKSIAVLDEDMKGIRGSRASAGFVDKIKVPYYGNPTPLKGVATITVPDPKTILITPWEKDVLSAIEAAIRDSDLNVNPSNDGSSIHINFPPLNEERRIELTKIVKDRAEETNVTLRNIRQDALQSVKKLEGEGKVTEDDRYRAEELLNKTIGQMHAKVDGLIEAKTQQMLEV